MSSSLHINAQGLSTRTCCSPDYGFRCSTTYETYSPPKVVTAFPFAYQCYDQSGAAPLFYGTSALAPYTVGYQTEAQLLQLLTDQSSPNCEAAKDMPFQFASKPPTTYQAGTWEVATFANLKAHLTVADCNGYTVNLGPERACANPGFVDIAQVRAVRAFRPSSMPSYQPFPPVQRAA